MESLNTISFSHKNYEKLKKIIVDKPIILLETFVKDRKYLHEKFIEYDTRYKTPSGNQNSFRLSNNKLLMLLFIDSENNLFTTLRPFNVKKARYYDAVRGQKFMIKFTENIEDIKIDEIKVKIPKVFRNSTLI
jgi:hypothetical protein